MRIGLLGTGHVARALGAAWATAGHDILLGSRSPEDRADLGLPVASPAEAAAHAEVLVNATPGTESLNVLTGIGAAALDETVLIDAAIGFTPEGTLSHPVESLGEVLQRTFPGTRVVKTLCTMTASVMADPGGLTEPGTVFLSGDDAAAKDTTERLLGDLGWPEASRLDIGGIETARGQEHFALLFLGIAGGLGTHTFNVRVVQGA
ncbi:NAD(P)-binding domain-containing protein [Streptomyces sp. NPDC047108]|uniref:NADPH-dependent F420 reductase n=1 Tax=Streptomyces sp. NPDC047108 TaxID=3155025 RepID=UPI0033CCF587